jgi:hypothetical protein
MLDTRLVGLSQLLQQRQQEQQLRQHQDLLAMGLPQHLQPQPQLRPNPIELLPRFAHHLAAVKSQLASASLAAHQQLATAEWLKTQLSSRPAPPPEPQLLPGAAAASASLKFPPPRSNFECSATGLDSLHGDNARESSVTHSDGTF